MPILLRLILNPEYFSVMGIQSSLWLFYSDVFTVSIFSQIPVVELLSNKGYSILDPSRIDCVFAIFFQVAQNKSGLETSSCYFACGWVHESKLKTFWSQHSWLLSPSWASFTLKSVRIINKGPIWNYRNINLETATYIHPYIHTSNLGFLADLWTEKCAYSCLEANCVD